MVPVALGTQTGGSVVRPASYCGIVGFKVSYGLISTEGVLPVAKSLDTIGFFTHTAADMLAFWGALGYEAGRAEDVSFAVPDPLPDVEPIMATAFRAAVERIRRAGLVVRPIDIAPMLVQVRQAQRTVVLYEGARFHEERYRQYGDRLGDIAKLVRDGLQVTVDKYDEARRFITECKIKMAETFKSTPVILTPAAPGPAPEGLASTGDPRLNGPWTALGTPAITIPMPVGSGLPLGLQMTADHGQDAGLLRAGIQLERLLGQAPVA
jgi:Asp-tRNA(Asn)/Glu-tRNA(Gln) amidotransferase A subunit family amidase